MLIAFGSRTAQAGVSLPPSSSGRLRLTPASEPPVATGAAKSGITSPSSGPRSPSPASGRVLIAASTTATKKASPMR